MIKYIGRTFQILIGRHDWTDPMSCSAATISDALDTLYFSGVGMSGYGWDRKILIGRIDWYLVILSSKTYVFEDKLTRCRSL